MNPVPECGRPGHCNVLLTQGLKYLKAFGHSINAAPGTGALRGYALAKDFSSVKIRSRSVCLGLPEFYWINRLPLSLVPRNQPAP